MATVGIVCPLWRNWAPTAAFVSLLVVWTTSCSDEGDDAQAGAKALRSGTCGVMEQAYLDCSLRPQVEDCDNGDLASQDVCYVEQCLAAFADDEECSVLKNRLSQEHARCAGECYDFEPWECGDRGDFIPETWRCDGEEDCPGGEDEDDDDCGYLCPDESVRITPDQVCDGQRDCDDGSDERPCFVCDDDSVIPHNYWVCDGQRDCPDGEDEAGCEPFECRSGGSVPWAWVCDGELDCDGGSDEEDCEVACGDGNGSIVARWICDGLRDCADGSDEQDCERECPDDSGTLLVQWICDGEPDCQDGSDEADDLCL